jgi:murein DD-endopeptidase MepM/ murein hydrolase activator NlpD
MGGKVTPVAGARISQEWGNSNIRYAAGRHKGKDFAAKTGTAVRSVAGGTVKRTGFDKAYGNYMAVGHKDGSTSFYAHLSAINAKAGTKVKSGQRIGAVGSTGRSTGSHLHIEIRKSDKYGGDINPRSWFSTR